MRPISHNIHMNNVKFRDMDLLGRIVNELSKGTAQLDMSAKRFRTYHGQPDFCNAAIRLQNGPHDIGLLMKDGAYTPVFDPYQMDTVFKHPASNNKIGLLQQEYGLRMAEYEAAQNGYSVQRIPGKNGSVQLEVLAG